MKDVEKLLYSAFSLGIVLFIILLLWLFLWKVILEPNPIIREFFDLDQKEKTTSRVKRRN